MYEVFYVNKSIRFQSFTNQAKPNEDFILDCRKDFSIKWLLGLIEQSPLGSELILYSRNMNRFKSKFESLFVKKFAAGGLVLNKRDDFLFIRKNGHWDLPKGHLEPNETHECAAKREVEEETGIGGLEVVKPIKSTKHFYQEGDGQWVLKETIWYLMRTNRSEQPKFENQEGISNAIWVSKKDLDSVLTNAFAAIRQVVAAGG